jgi:hypothetical protein
MRIVTCDVRRSAPALNDLIKTCLATGRPLAFGKIGGFEGQHILQMLSTRRVTWDKTLGINAGVFPLEEPTVARWAGAYIDAIRCLDGVIQWHPDGCDRALLQSLNPTAFVSQVMEDLLPLALGSESWHYGLAGKHVLLVHPMTHTIRAQAERFPQLWPGASIGGLILVRAPYPPWVSGRAEFNSYFDALESMKQAIAGAAFDFAIVGAGGYSLPLVKFIKDSGRPVIHLGGRAQLLFGILGRRWDAEPQDWKTENYYGTSPFWVRPLPEDVPAHKDLVEGGCYW